VSWNRLGVLGSSSLELCPVLPRPIAENLKRCLGDWWDMLLELGG
jgi:hypothetical protein